MYACIFLDRSDVRNYFSMYAVQVSAEQVLETRQVATISISKSTISSSESAPSPLRSISHQKILGIRRVSNPSTSIDPGSLKISSLVRIQICSFVRDNGTKSKQKLCTRSKPCLQEVSGAESNVRIFLDVFVRRLRGASARTPSTWYYL